MILERTKEDVNNQIDLASDLINEGGKYPGMCYEDGVKNALEWAIGHVDEKPIEDWKTIPGQIYIQEIYNS